MRTFPIMRLLVLCAALLKVTLLLADENPQNVRELCRLEVAGTLLNLENDIRLYKDQISIAQQRGKDLRTRLVSLERDYTALKQMPPTAIPAFDVDERVVSLRYSLQSVRVELDENEKNRESNQAMLLKTEARLKQLNSLVEPLFVWSQVSRVPDGALPRQLTYRHACSAYHLLCPLPTPDATALVKLAKELATGLPCERYSSIH